MNITVAIKELKKCAGIQFDPMLVDKFIQILLDWKFSKDIDSLKYYQI
jgi:response regulator RpfG family c-di-GMP phosphodiesterase